MENLCKKFVVGNTKVSVELDDNFRINSRPTFTEIVPKRFRDFDIIVLNGVELLSDEFYSFNFYDNNILSIDLYNDASGYIVSHLRLDLSKYSKVRISLGKSMKLVVDIE